MTTRDDIDALARELAERFDPEQIILFGSHAYGEPTEDSDVDLVVVMDYDGRARDQRLALRRAVRHLNLDVPIDLLVYRPADFARRAAGCDPIPHAARYQGAVLYGHERQRVA